MREFATEKMALHRGATAPPSPVAVVIEIAPSLPAAQNLRAAFLEKAGLAIP